jgi:hypothetical protein
MDPAADRAEDRELDRADLDPVAVDLDLAAEAQDQAADSMAADFPQPEAESVQLVIRRRHPTRNRPRGPERPSREPRGEVASVR